MGKSQEQEPFLGTKVHEGGNRTTKLSNGFSAIVKSNWKPSRTSLTIHAILITLYTICSIVAVYALRKPYPRPSAFDNLSFQTSKTVFYNLSQSPFAGPPSPEIDSAWNNLLAPMYMRVSREELRRDDQESVQLPEGGGYLAWMGAFHELHCLRMLREWNYKSYYHAELTGDEQDHLASHIDHCFEMLRQSAVCHADTSLTTFKWDPKKTRPMFNASNTIHTCVDWDVLMKSAAGRVVEEDEILRLKNPLINTS